MFLVSKAPTEKDLITTNSTCVRLNLLTWDSNGCPLSQFVVSMKKFEESKWKSQSVSPGAQPFLVCGLPAATWHHLKVVATSAAGSTTASYYFATLTENGGKAKFKFSSIHIIFGVFQRSKLHFRAVT